MNLLCWLGLHRWMVTCRESDGMCHVSVKCNRCGGLRDFIAGGRR